MADIHLRHSSELTSWLDATVDDGIENVLLQPTVPLIHI